MCSGLHLHCVDLQTQDCVSPGLQDATLFVLTHSFAGQYELFPVSLALNGTILPVTQIYTADSRLKEGLRENLGFKVALVPLEILL